MLVLQFGHSSTQKPFTVRAEHLLLQPGPGSYCYMLFISPTAHRGQHPGPEVCLWSSVSTQVCRGAGRC
ncbi:hypothetical protein NDU88_004272 [Pleurodeles waltl]|uniref:Uncharacterized protein n=1 Tax=Pleurodeles waltl TaxID=8319 RepID=A0AAV7T8A9_PLEWA|nr:hypothetical protein NDU88_004272 [Pleurodeles waltl]